MSTMVRNCAVERPMEKSPDRVKTGSKSPGPRDPSPRASSDSAPSQATTSSDKDNEHAEQRPPSGEEEKGGDVPATEAENNKDAVNGVSDVQTVPRRSRMRKRGAFRPKRALKFADALISATGEVPPLYKQFSPTKCVNVFRDAFPKPPTEPITTWSEDVVMNIVTNILKDKVAGSIYKKNGVDGFVLASMTTDKHRELGVKMGHALKIWSFVNAVVHKVWAE